MNTFYGYIDNLNWEGGVSTKFYPSIEELILDDNESGDIIEFWISHKPVGMSGINPWMNTVPTIHAKYSLHTIEEYELFEWLKDEPEMNEQNYMVFSRSDENHEGMLTIVELHR
jgi:hypothetical protein